MTAQTPIDGLKVKELANSTLSFPQLYRDLPRILKHGDLASLEALRGVFAEADASWFVADESRKLTFLVAERILTFLLDVAFRENPSNRDDDDDDDDDDDHFERTECAFSLLLCLTSRMFDPRIGDPRQSQETDSVPIRDSNLNSRVPRNERNCGLDARFARHVVSVISIYSGPHPWTNPVLNARCKDLEEAFLRWNGGASMTESLLAHGDRRGARGESTNRVSNKETLDTVTEKRGTDKPLWMELLESRLKSGVSEKTSTWNRAEKASFFWLVRTVERPRQLAFISRAFTTTLSFLSSSHERDQIFGLKCSMEILQNAPAPIAKSMGYFTILADVLGKLMSSNHAPLLSLLHPCVLLLIERHHVAANEAKDPNLKLADRDSTGPSVEDVENPDTPRNKLYLRMLILIEMGGGICEKEAMKHLGTHIRGMGIALCRYLKRTVSVLCGKLQGAGDEFRDSTHTLVLEALCDVIRSARPRMSNHVQYIVNHVIVLALDVRSKHSTNSDFTRDNVVEKCKRVLLDLANVAPSALSRALDVHPVHHYDDVVAAMIGEAIQRTIIHD